MIGVVVPYRPGPGRHGLARIVDHLAHTFGTAPIVADDHHDPFSRGQSIMAGIRRLPTDTTVVVVCDADLLVPADQLVAAADAAADTDGLVVAFDRYHYLTADQSAIIERAPFPPLPDRPATEWTMAGSVGGAHAYSTATIARTGGYPPVFRGWGMEDLAFDRIASLLAGPTRRIPGPAWHLWHPVDATNDPTRPSYRRNVAALTRILDAADPSALRAVLADLEDPDGLRDL